MNFLYNSKKIGVIAVWSALFGLVALSSAVLPLASQGEHNDMMGCMVPTERGMECAMALTDYMAHLNFKTAKDDRSPLVNLIFLAAFGSAVFFIFRKELGTYVSRYLKEHPEIEKITRASLHRF